LAFNAWTVSATESQAKRDKDASLMSAVQDHTNSVLDGMEQMLNLLVKAAEDGRFEPHEEYAVKNCKRKLMRLEKDLSETFHRQRLEVTKAAPDVPAAMYKDVRIAQVLQWSISRIVGEVILLADGVAGFSKGEETLPPPPDGEGFLAMFRGIGGKEHMLYAWRGITSYLLSFTLGYFGFRHIVHPYSAGIAGTAPLLLSMYVGSALVNDLNRIQGLMIGNVISRIIIELVDGCDTSDLLIHAFLTFSWVWIGLFVSFHSASYSTVGLLAAAFGASTLLSESCDHLDSNTAHKRETFDALAMNCLAVMITMCVDFLFQADRASDQAYALLNESWRAIHLSLSDIFNPECETVAFHSKSAKRLLSEALQMGEEANLEPRFWRTAWPQELFTGICRLTDSLIIATASLESAIAEHGRDGDAKFATFVQLSKISPNSQELGLFGNPSYVDLLRRFSEVQSLLRIFVHETSKRFESESNSNEQMGLQILVQERKVEQHFIQQTVPNFFGLADDKPEVNMSHDEMAHLSVVFAARARIKALLSTAQHLILSAHFTS